MRCSFSRSDLDHKELLMLCVDFGQDGMRVLVVPACRHSLFLSGFWPWLLLFTVQHFASEIGVNPDELLQ